MSGLDCALAENDWIDPERLGTSGIHVFSICQQFAIFPTSQTTRMDKELGPRRTGREESLNACGVVGVCGGSYGGYMTMWIVTQTGRFKAAVAHAGLSNHISFYVRSDTI